MKYLFVLFAFLLCSMSVEAQHVFTRVGNDVSITYISDTLRVDAEIRIIDQRLNNLAAAQTNVTAEQADYASYVSTEGIGGSDVPPKDYPQILANIAQAIIDLNAEKTTKLAEKAAIKALFP